MRKSNFELYNFHGRNQKEQWWWSYVASNGRVVARSDVYTSKAAALKGMESLQRGAGEARFRDYSEETVHDV